MGRCVTIVFAHNQGRVLKFDAPRPQQNDALPRKVGDVIQKSYLLTDQRVDGPDNIGRTAICYIEGRTAGDR